MNLTIDQGNSSAKVSVFDGNDMVAVARFDLLSISALARIIKSYGVNAAAYSSVRRPDARIIELLRKRVKKFICLDHNTPLPVVIDYDSPCTLGQDRVAADTTFTITAGETKDMVVKCKLQNASVGVSISNYIRYCKPIKTINRFYA